MVSRIFNTIDSDGVDIGNKQSQDAVTRGGLPGPVSTTTIQLKDKQRCTQLDKFYK